MKEAIIKILQEEASYMYPIAVDNRGKVIDAIKLVDKNKAADLILKLLTP